jgi:4'-phosphopantetheinyl transferase
MTESPAEPLAFTPTGTAPPLPANAIHLWRIELDRFAIEFGDPLLSADERERARRFATPTLQRRFTVARASLRQILADYLSAMQGELGKGGPSIRSKAPPSGAATRATGVRPKQLRFEYGPHGKPSLPAIAGPYDAEANGVRAQASREGHGREASPPLEFNLSHSGEVALLALSTAPVGIDLEPIRPLTDALAIARRTFPPAIADELAGLQGSHLLTRFFHHWTALEARVKLHGEAIFTGDRVDENPQTLHHLIPKEGWIACLASNLPDPAISGFSFCRGKMEP